MNERHKELVKEAEEAIGEVASDLSVSQEQTLESLEELEAYIQISIQALREDLEQYD